MMETENILLRPWQESDAETLYNYASDPEVGPRAGWPPHKSVEESLEVIRTIFSAEGMWAVVWKKTDEAIGCVGYLPASSSNLQIADDQCEVGYWIARPYWGKGICTEALQMVIDHCFHEKGFTTLWGSYFPSNPASGRIMEKCGFVDTGQETLCPNLEIGSDRPVKVMQLHVLPPQGESEGGGSFGALSIERLKQTFSEGGAQEIYREIKATGHFLGFARQYAFSADYRVARSALWGLTKANKEELSQLQVILDQLIDQAMQTENSSVRRLTLNIVERLELNEDSLRTDFLDFCFDHMMNVEEYPGIQSVCMKLAYRMCKFFPELMDELKRTLEAMEIGYYKPAVKGLRSKILSGRLK